LAQRYVKHPPNALCFPLIFPHKKVPFFDRLLTSKALLLSRQHPFSHPHAFIFHLFFHFQIHLKMKQTVLFLLAFCLGIPAFAQQTIQGTLEHDGLQREYILYVPAGYTGDAPVPLVLNFHGYTSNANEQMFYGDFRTIADTAGFLVVHPEGTLLNGSTHWNVGGWTIGSTVDDVGFTAALIDHLAENYNINLKRVYATGMSNGGFMSHLLACQLSERIAAIASVTGSMTPETYDNCNPQHPMPVLQIHGTADPVVPYGGAPWTRPVQDAIDYWVAFNHCTKPPTVTPVPDIVTTDLSTVDYIVYPDGDNGVTTEHFKVYNGGHTWPGSAINIPVTNYDINASVEIWKFFAQYDLDGRIDQTTATSEAEAPDFAVFPNPTTHFVQIEHHLPPNTPYTLFSALGTRLLSGTIPPGQITLNLRPYPAGMYFLTIGEKTVKIQKTDF